MNERSCRALGMGAMLVVVASIVMACGGAEGPADAARTLDVTLEGGVRMHSGELKAAAVAEARSYDRAVVLWLGESFQGLYLTHAQELADGSFFLIYGACEPAPRDREPSCVPPLQIQVRPPGGIPPGARVGPVPFRGVYRTLGELGPRPDPDWSTILWLPDGGTVKLYIQNFVLGDIMEDALQALETANHDALGVDAVGPGESLAALTR